MAAVVTAIAVGALGFAVLGGVARGKRRRTAAGGSVPGLQVTSIQFWLTVGAAGVATFVIVFALTGLVAVSLVPAALVATLPRAYYSRQRSRRLSEVQQAWPDGLRDLLASIRSGASLPSAIEALAAHGPGPLREAFQGFNVYARSLGAVAALEMVKEDLADPTSDRVIEVLILAYERGGTVVPEILTDLAEATTRDLWTLEEVRSEALEQKINSRVVFVLPWLVLVAITMRSGPFREFYATSAGVLVVAIGGVMSLLGVFIASRLASQPTEPRVFGGQQ